MNLYITQVSMMSWVSDHDSLLVCEKNVIEK